MKELRKTLNTKIVLLIINVLLACSCSNIKNKNSFKGLLLYEFKKENNIDVYSMSKYLIFNDSIYPFYSDKNINNFFEKDIAHPYYDKSPFDYESKDSIYNLDLSQQINLTKKSDYIYTIGNRNFYTKQSNFYLCFTIEMIGKRYNFKKPHDFPNGLIPNLVDGNKVIVLDSLISLSPNETKMRSLDFIINDIKNIEVHFLGDDEQGNGSVQPRYR